MCIRHRRYVRLIFYTVLTTVPFSGFLPTFANEHNNKSICAYVEVSYFRSRPCLGIRHLDTRLKASHFDYPPLLLLYVVFSYFITQEDV